MPRLLPKIPAAGSRRLHLPSAESLDRLLIGIGALAPDGPVERLRLHVAGGQSLRTVPALHRVYPETSPGVAALPSFGADPCGTCPYDAHCDAGWPALRKAKTHPAG